VHQEKVIGVVLTIPAVKATLHGVLNVLSVIHNDLKELAAIPAEMMEDIGVEVAEAEATVEDEEEVVTVAGADMVVEVDMVAEVVEEEMVVLEKEIGLAQIMVAVQIIFRDALNASSVVLQRENELFTSIQIKAIQHES